jgi:long-chain acyl-CoA synthetase
MTLSFQQLVKDGKGVEVDLNQFSVQKILKNNLAKFPDKEALVFADLKSGVQESLTYRQLVDQVMALAEFLRTEHSLNKGDAVALHLENTPEILLFHLACWLIGCITVPLDLKRDDSDRKAYKLRLTACKAVVVDEAVSAAESALFGRVSGGLKIIPMSASIRQKIAKGKKLADQSISEDPNNICLILFTSGTTNLPKGVQLSVANLLLNADGIRDWLKITENDRFHIVLPLHHINSTTMSLATLLAGGTIILSPRYSKSNFWRIMAEHHCTLSSIVPTICFDMLTETEAFKQYQPNLKQVSRIQIGSAPVQPTDVTKFYDLYRIKLVQGYGSTETALRVTGVDWQQLDDSQYRELVTSNTIGGELKWNNATVLAENGQPAAEKEEGEICLRGPVLTKGYLDNEEANQEAFIDGWFHSGDVGYWQHIFGQKNFFLTGRKKEIIIKGGVNISPLMIEHAILVNYPQISTCYVAGAPDARFGEEIGVVVAFDESVEQEVQQQTIETLKQDAQAGLIKGVSNYESPKYILKVPLSSLPMTSTGKVQRVNIKEYFQGIFSPIAETSSHSFRRLTPFDIDHITKLVEIHNLRWGSELGITVETATQAVANGIVIAALDKKTGQLVGSAFAEQVHAKDIETKATWLNTYDQATGNLTLKPSTSDGDAILLVSISTAGKPFTPSMKPDEPEYRQLLSAAPKHIDTYLAANTDPVLNFHQASKAGMKEGASIMYPIENARPADIEALGYCVMMKYPTLPENVAVQENSSLGTQILEAGFVYAVKNKISQVYAYSRPSGFVLFILK